MALFKINKGLASNLAKNMPYAKEGFAYFTKDDGKFYIDIEGDGTTTKAIVNINRIPLNAAKADVATMIQATAMATDDNKVYPILAFNITDSTKNLVEAKYSQIGIKNGTLVIPSVEDKDEILISNEGLGRGIVIDNKGTNNAIEILNGKGIKVAQDPTENLELTTKQYVDNQNVVLELNMAGSTYWTDQTSYDFTLSAKAQAAYSRLIEAIEKGYIPTVIIHDIDNTYIYKYSFTQNLILPALLVFTVEIPLSKDGNHMGRDFIAFQSNGSGSTLTVQRLNKPLEYIPGDGKVNQILSVSNNGQATWLDIPSIEDLGGATKDHNHDDRYYTETEVDTKLGKKSDTVHKHTKSDITDFAHTHTKADITNFAHTHQNFSATRLNNEDLNDYLGGAKMGWYYAAGTNNVSNKPSNVDAFGLLVWRSAEGYYIQTLVSANKDSSRIYTRQLSGSGATPWITTYTSTEIDTKLNNVLSANDAMIFKGVVNSNADLPSTHEVGWTYRVGKAGTYANAKCEVGDLLICITDGLSTDAKHWIAVQANIDGAVIGPANATDSNIALFDGNSGKLIKDSGKKIGDFAPSEHSHTITANAEDDDVVVLVGTNGTKAVTYKATHAKNGPGTADTAKGPNADVSISGAGKSGSITIPKVTVDAYGHTTGLTEQKLTITLPAAYSHPTTSGNKHIPAGGSAGQILRWSAEGTAAWGTDNDTHHQSSTVITNSTAEKSNAASENGSTYLNHIENGTVRSTHKIVGAGGTTVSSDASGTLTITSENTVYEHPTSDGNKHLPAGGKAGDILLWDSLGTGKWGILVAGSNVTLTPDANNDKITIAATNTDTKVTEVGNHYTPVADSKATLSVDASSTTAATWNTTSLVTGVNLQRDAKGHVTGVTVDSIKMPANPNTDTDTKVTQTVTTTNATYPLLLAPAGQTATTTTQAYFDSGVTLNPSTNTITADLAGNASTATKVKNNLIIKLNSGTTEETNQFTYNGSAAKTINITPSGIGAALSSHNHDSVYVKKTGDTMSGNLTISQSNANDTHFKVTNSNGSIGLLTSTNQGLYDYANSKWIVYHNKSNGINYFNGLATKATQDGNGLQIDSNYLKLSGGTVTGEVAFTNANAIRFIQGSGTTKSVLMRNDGNNFYIVPCNATSGNSWYIPSGGSEHSFRLNLGNGFIYTTKLFGAAWNDYAEFRNGDTIEAGRCIVEVGDDTLITSTDRMIPGANITSDTFGFAIGETKQAKTPIAVSGRVLAYPYESREEFKKNIGRPVCSGPNGTVSIMTDEEYRDKGYCAIGTISAVPDYEEWGSGNVKVNGRVWIKVF